MLQFGLLLVDRLLAAIVQSQRSNAMARAFWRYWGLVTILTALVIPTAPSAQTAPSAANQNGPRFVVYFDEFSAFLSDEAKTIIADAAKRARETGAHRIVIQARASATGTAETNKYLAQTRSSIVTDQLEADGISRPMIQQEPIGQTGSSDPSVYNRRVDIIVEP
jgi:outer membrane protein OmpA-like peptidoglycan-associated protein